MASDINGSRALNECVDRGLKDMLYDKADFFSPV